ncbi:MAG: AmmeMemoRadiSam system protein B [Paludibacter sp.]|jgi:AmmeMemoRadiSam system protein B|nr:AmmeMemoRadiSam system protein B [Paludibacter sp.]
MSTFNKSHNRFASVAGQYYPASRQELQTELTRLFTGAVQKQYDTVRAIIAPHASYIFSGKIAASAYSQIDSKKAYKRIFLLTSSRLDSFIGASVFCNGDYVVPNGIAEVDTLFSKQLASEHPILFRDARTPHFHEHSIEVQIPFLLHHLTQPFKIVPIVLGTHTPEICKQLAKVLQPELNDDNLFIICSDFSSFLPASTAQRIDEETEQAICTNKPDKLLKTLDRHQLQKYPGYSTSLAGWSAVLTLLYMTSGNPELHYKLIDQCNSGDIPYYGNHERVTGYRALALIEKALSEEEKKRLSGSLMNKFKRIFGK